MLVSVLCRRIVVMVFDEMIEDDMERRKARLVAHGLKGEASRVWSVCSLLPRSRAIAHIRRHFRT